MKNNQKGFAIQLAIAIVAILVIGALYFSVKKDALAPAQTTSTSTKPVASTTVTTNTPKVTTTSTKPAIPTTYPPAATVNTSGASSIGILSPNGGNFYEVDETDIGASIPVTFSIKNISGLSVYLVDSAGKSVASVTDTNPDKETSFIFFINQNKTVNVIKSGEYKIKICDLKGNICDSSDKSFVIRSFTSGPAMITVAEPAVGEMWKIGSQHKISFTTKGNIKPEYRVAVMILNPKFTQLATVAATSTSYLWTIPKTICWEGNACGYLAPGSYTMSVRLYDREPSADIPAKALDESEMKITITN